MRRTTAFLISLIVLTGVASGQAPEKVRILLITGENNHAWKLTTPVLRDMLEASGKFEVKVTEEPATLETDALASYDAIMLNYNRRARWTEKQEQALLDYVRGGKGLVVVHASNNAFPEWPEYERMIGGAWREGSGHDRYGPFMVKIEKKDHPITRGMEDFQTVDELYFGLRLQEGLNVLATAFSKVKNATQPMVWTLDYGKGRVFHITLGHDVPAMLNPNFIRLVLRGSEWAARGQATIK